MAHMGAMGHTRHRWVRFSAHARLNEGPQQQKLTELVLLEGSAELVAFFLGANLGTLGEANFGRAQRTVTMCPSRYFYLFLGTTYLIR